MRRREDICGYLKITDVCSVCSLWIAGHDVGAGPVVPAMLIIGSAVVGAALYVELAFEPPWWLHIVLWTSSVLGLVFGYPAAPERPAGSVTRPHRSTKEDGGLGGT